MSPRTGARRRLGSIRLSLILLALVPSVTLAAMWGVTTKQMFDEGLRLRGQTQLSRSTGAMGTEATLALQRERSLSAAWLADDPRGSRAALEAQRGKTDKAVAKLVGQSDAINKAPARISDRLYSVLGSVGSLEYYRGQVDNPTDITAAQALEQYSSIIDDQIHAFQELSQVDDGDLTSQAGPLVALEHAAELVAREDAQLTLAWPSGQLSEKSWATFTQLVATRRWLVEDQIVPALQGSAKAQTERILQSSQWQTVQDIEDQVLTARPSGSDGKVALPHARVQWATAFATVGGEYGQLIGSQTSGLLDRSGDKAHSLLVKAASLSAGGLAALLLCVGMSWRITRSLSRRLRGLREATLSLAEKRLPDVVARLDRGEKVDADLATPPLDYGGDELGQVARAFNKAQRTAVHTAVELADTRRGFQKVILGIARQSQNLVNLQLTKLDALEREHTDPDVLNGLYELDSTASQLRRYEENLVIISGEQPRRSWREPVALIDILRSAVGEVAEYQRVEVHTDEDVYLAPPAVADVIHLLAELIDNATAYSPSPAPVGVRAALVAKGLAIEVEDRGLGLSEEDYASFNAQLAVEPQFDVVALADDLRLGMFVIARLATRHGIAVTLRPSPYGGTTAIVLLPHEIVVREVAGPDGTDTDGDRAGGRSRRKRAETADWDGQAPPGTPGEQPRSGAAAAPPRAVPDSGEREHSRAGEAAPSGEPGRTVPSAHPPREIHPDAGQADDTGNTRETSGSGPTETTEDTPHAGQPHDTRNTQDTSGSRPTETTEDTPHAGQADGATGPRPARRVPADAHTGAGEADGARAGGEAESAADAGRAEGTGHTLGAEPGEEDGRAADGGRSGAAGRTGTRDEADPGPGVRSPVPHDDARTGEARRAEEAARTGGTEGAAGEEGAGGAGHAREDGRLGARRRRPGLTPLPRRVPQTSLAAELREECPGGEQDGSADDFTAEQAASSLAGFQRGTLRARQEDAEQQHDQDHKEEPSAPEDPDERARAAGTAARTRVPSTPPADR